MTPRTAAPAPSTAADLQHVACTSTRPGGRRMRAGPTSQGETDPAFPRFHVRPERGWLGGPSGLFTWRGRHHLFFQHNPDSTRGDAPSLGHATSDDLCDWRLE